MKNTKLITALALSLSLTLVSCEDDADKTAKNTVTSAPAVVSKAITQQSSVMDFIPAETPVLAVFVNDPKHPIPQNFQDKMDKVYSSLGEMMKTTYLDAYKEYTKKANPEADTTSIDEFAGKWFNEEGIKKLGLKMGETEFAFYLIDLFPVMRLNLAPSHSMGEILDEMMAKANEDKPDQVTKRDVKGTTLYQFGDKEMQAMVSLKGNTIVASLAPTRQVDSLMPKLLGFEKPAKTIRQSNQFNDTIAKYNYLGNSLMWINFRELADYFVNPAQHQTAMLDVLKVQDNMMSQDCKNEVLAMFDKFPRLVSGSTLLDEHQMDTHMIIEMPSDLGSKLSTISGRIPNAKNAAFSYGFSFDIAAAKTLAQEFVTNIETTPYKCEFFTEMNAKAGMFKAQLEQPLPPFVGNFKGFNIVVDELDLDMTKTDPAQMIKTLKAKVLLAVDNPEALKGMAEMMIPDVQKLGLKTGGKAVNISDLIPVKGTMMPINLDHVFLAMGDETIGLSLGENTDGELAVVVAGESTSALLDFSINSALYKNIFESISSADSKLPEEVKKQFAIQKTFMSDMLWWKTEKGAVDFTNRGFEVNVGIDY
jgi:hypothetical protein